MVTALDDLPGPWAWYPRARIISVVETRDDTYVQIANGKHEAEVVAQREAGRVLNVGDVVSVILLPDGLASIVVLEAS